MAAPFVFQEDETDQEPVELMVVTVGIGGGRQETLKIFENDNPVRLAQKFAEKHALDAKARENLEKFIQANLESVKKGKPGKKGKGKAANDS